MSGKKFELEKLLELLKKYDLTELTVKEGRSQVTLKKEGMLPPYPHQVIPGIDDEKGGLPPAAAMRPPLDAPLSGPQADPADHFHEVKAPLVGTFYRAPSPDADPFVEEGDAVSVNDKLCIVEAMKIMNEIESPMSGIVREICVKNGSPVEFGQVLFRLEVDEDKA